MLEVGTGGEEHVPGPEHGDAQEEEDGIFDVVEAGASSLCCCG